jgi:hypothetical protein
MTTLQGLRQRDSVRKAEATARRTLQELRSGDSSGSGSSGSGSSGS